MLPNGHFAARADEELVTFWSPLRVGLLRRTDHQTSLQVYPG